MHYGDWIIHGFCILIILYLGGKVEIHGTGDQNLKAILVISNYIMLGQVTDFCAPNYLT